MRSPQFALSTMDTGGDSLQKGVMKIPTKYSVPNPGALSKKLFDDFYGTSGEVVATDPQQSNTDQSVLDKVKGIDLADPLGLGKQFNAWQDDLFKRSMVGLLGLAVLIIGIYIMAK